jgi:hypothetical protein
VCLEVSTASELNKVSFSGREPHQESYKNPTFQKPPASHRPDDVDGVGLRNVGFYKSLPE